MNSEGESACASGCSATPAPNGLIGNHGNGGGVIRIRTEKNRLSPDVG